MGGMFKSRSNREKNDDYGDSGSASRFFKSIIYNPKASKAERNKGCEGLDIKQNLQGLDNRGRTLEREDGSKTLVDRFSKTPATNNHPTVKPIALMEYLIKMVTPKGGIVLDPFMGSGSTGVAAKKNGYDFIGIDMTPEYIEIAKARIEATEIENKLL
jgi:site-specific DNA-methyltransferase (adenine-specific)